MSLFNKLSKALKQAQVNSEERKKKELENLPMEIEKVKLQTELAKARAELDKVKNKDLPKKGDCFGFGSSQSLFNEDAIKKDVGGVVKKVKKTVK